MNALLTLAILFSVSVSALAEVGTNARSFLISDDESSQSPSLGSEGESAFDTLLIWYNQGEPLNFEELGGFYSGRCFRRKEKNTPNNSALGYAVLKNFGPGFPDERLYFTLTKHNTPADAFDEMDLSELKKAFNRLGRQEQDEFSNPTLNPAVTDLDWEPNGNLDERHEFVVFEDFIVEKWTAQFRQNYNGVWANPGDVLGMCYYFKNLGE